MISLIPYGLPFFIAAAGNFLVVGLCWPHRRARGAGALIALSVSAGIWAGCEGLLYFGFDRVTDIRITQVQYLGIVGASLAVLFFVLALLGLLDRIPRIVQGLFFVVPVITLVLVWTNGRHRLIWSRTWMIRGGPVPMLGLVHGPAFWVFVVYDYLLLGSVTLLLFHQARTAVGHLRSQAVLLLAALGIVWFANGIYLCGLSPIRHVDTTPIAFTVLAGAMAWALLRHRLLDLLPVAKEEIFYALADGVVVLDAKGRILDLNPAAEVILAMPRKDAVGRPVREVSDLCAVTEPESIISGVGIGDICIHDKGTPGRVYDLRTSVIKDRKGRCIGYLQVWRDISERKSLEQKLERLARTDPLTGANNRRFFMQVANTEVRRCQRYGGTLSMMMIDIDHFKRINDRFGHLAGDAVLVATAKACHELLRDADIFGRLGGEEFAVLCVETNAAGAVALAERLRSRLAGQTMLVDGKPIAITVSIGIASLDRHARDPLHALLKHSDRALYRAKFEGRNRVCSEI